MQSVISSYGASQQSLQQFSYPPSQRDPFTTSCHSYLLLHWSCRVVSFASTLLVLGGGGKLFCQQVPQAGLLDKQLVAIGPGDAGEIVATSDL